MKRYRIEQTSHISFNGIEFEVDEEATEEEVARAAADAVAECLSYGWSEILVEDHE